jgi:hypothetical protein
MKNIEKRIADARHKTSKTMSEFEIWAWWQRSLPWIVGVVTITSICAWILHK